MTAIYALNLFDLAANEDYRSYSRESRAAVERHGGKVVAMGRLAAVIEASPGVDPRKAMILVEWESQAAFNSFLEDREIRDLHELRSRGTRNYLWWSFEKLSDLRPLFE